jgi:multiple sugar transport system permease protein
MSGGTKPPLLTGGGALRIDGWKKAIWFLLPYIIGLITFTLGPLVASLIISFHKWDLFTSPRFVGFANYSNLFKDPLFWKSLLNTFYFTSVAVPLGVLTGLFFAILMKEDLPFMKILRAIYFMPVFTPMVAVAMVWSWLYEPEYGLFNSILTSIGIKGPDWLGSEKWAMFSIIIMSVWKGFGYSMVIYLAALQDIPKEYTEVALLEGANAFQRFRYITFPLLTPITFFLIVMNVITSMQVFDQIYVMTKGGPNDATTTLVFYLYRNGFEYFKMEYASSIAWVLFLITLVLTLFQLYYQKRWVFYG